MGCQVYFVAFCVTLLCNKFLQNTLRREVKSLLHQRTSVITNQKLVLVFGLEHGRHLLQVHAVPLLLQLRGEEHGDDPLGDVGQVEVVVSLHDSLHHTVHTEAPGQGNAEGG